MKSKYILLFSIALLLMVSTFVLAQNQQKHNKKIPPGKDKQLKENKIKDNSDKAHIEKGNNNDKNQNDYNLKDYKKAEKVTICHKEGDENVSITVNKNALDAHLAHGDTEGDCIYNDESDPDEFILKRRNARSEFYTAAVEAEDIIDVTTRRLEIAKNKIDLATQKLSILRTQPEIEEEVIKEKEAAINTVQQLVQELEQQISTTRLKLQQDRQILSNLRID